MKLNKYFYLLASLFFFVSCSNEHNEDALSEFELLNLELKPTSMDMEAFGDESVDEELIENETRSWNYNITNKGTKLDLNAKDVSNKDSVDIPSVVVLAKGNVKYLLNITWSKKKGQNHLRVKNGKLPATDLRGQSIALSAGDWYIAAILDKSINTAAPDNTKYKVGFDPNGFDKNSNKIVPLNEGEKITQDVPIYLPWTKVKVVKSGSEFMVYGTKKHNISLTFKSFGNMLRIKLRNDATYQTRVKGLSLESNVVRTSSGAFDLLASTTPVAGAMPFNWDPKQKTDQQVFKIDSYELAPSTGLTKNKKDASYIVWFAPITNANPRTHIIANVKRLHNKVEQNLPTMNRLYVWGSTGQPNSSKKFVANATIYREKQILEYFSFDHIMKPVNPLGQGYTKEEAIYELSKPKYSDRKFPHINELYALGPNTPHGSGLNNFTGSGDVTIPNLEYRVNGVDGTYTDIFRNGTVIYALRSDAQDRIYYAAWRYIPRSKSNTGKGIIESVYLGRHYKGNISDIATDAFWTTHSSDIIRQSFSTGFLYFTRNQIYQGIVASTAHGFDGKTAYNIGNAALSRPFGGFTDKRSRIPINATILPLENPGTPWKNN